MEHWDGICMHGECVAECADGSIIISLVLYAGAADADSDAGAGEMLCTTAAENCCYFF